MDPVIVGVALIKRRQLRYLARANLWEIRGLGPVLNGMRQIPIERGGRPRSARQGRGGAARGRRRVTDFVRFPRRPRVRVVLFEPAGGQSRDGEEPGELAERLLAELRDRVPPAAAGRRVRVSP